MRVLLGVIVLLALSTMVLAADEQEQMQARPKWIRGEPRHWPQWGAFKLRWLKAERREAVRDKDDAVRELAIVKSWGRTFVRNRIAAITGKANNRAGECRHFDSLHNIRAGNFKFHKGAHRPRRAKPTKRRRSLGPDARRRKPKTKKSKKSGKGYYYRKYSLHARMLLTSRDRLAAAKRAKLRCWSTVKKLRNRRVVVEKKSRATARAAVLRAQKHVQLTTANLKKVDSKLAKLAKKIKARVASYKTYFFHRCRRVKGQKFQCMYSIRHGGGDYSRLPHKFAKCLWASSNAVVVRYTCFK